MKIKIKWIVSVLLIPLFFLVKQISAQIELPQISTACETKSGNLYAFNDGFSNLSKCEGDSRRVVLIGEKGEIGEQGIQGEPGLQGEKGDKGDPGNPAPTQPPVEEIMVFDYGDLSGVIEPKVIDLNNHRVFTINCLVDQGDGGVKTWSSDDQINWNLEYRDGCGGVAQKYYQNTAKVKARYYKIVLEGSFKGYVSVLAN